MMPEKWTPAAFQKKAISFIVSRACAGIFDDPGMRKTSTMLAAFNVLRSKGVVERMLVLSPLRPAQATWPNEVARWEEFKHLDLRVLHGADKTWHNAKEAHVSVINYEGVPWLMNEARMRKEWPWQVLVIDESTAYKHTNTQRFKVLKPHLDKFHRRYILTGTPSPNGLIDLFGQVFVLDLGKSLTPHITKYRQEFFTPDQWGFNWKLKPGSEERIYKLLKPLVLRRAAEDYLDLPPLIYNRVDVTLPPDAMRVYRQMEAVLVADVEGGRVTAANVAAAVGKCRQIANGGMYGAGEDGERVTHSLHNAKVDAVKELIDELSGQPALVAYEFDSDRERLQKALGKDTPFIGGGVSGKRFKEIESEWNKGQIPVLLAQPASAALGLNLQAGGHTVIEAGLTWNLEHRQQLVRRLYRSGQTMPVTVHSIVAKGTVDELVLKVLAAKDRSQGALLDALKERKR